MSVRQAHLELAFDQDELDHLYEGVDDEKCSWSDLLIVCCLTSAVVGLCGIVHALFT